MRWYILLCISPLLGINLYPQVINSTQTDEITNDLGTVGKADPGDQIRYKVTITETGITSNATGVQLNVTLDALTTLVSNSFRSSPVAVNDGPYACIGNVGINVPIANGVKANDFDDAIGSATVAVMTNPTHGTLVLNPNGSFSYMPNPGYEGSDNFTYTLTDFNPVGGPIPTTDMATVTIMISGMIWFVDNNAGSNGDGRLGMPFNTLANFVSGAADDAGDNIFLFRQTASNYTGGISLLNNQKLIGQGATTTVAIVTGLTVPAYSNALPTTNGTRPIIINSGGIGIQLASGNAVSGLDVGNCNGFGIDDNGSVGTLNVSDVSINNTTGGGFRTDNGGTVNMTGTNNTISVGAASALNVTNTTIGASNLNFKSISSNGASSPGIVLNNTGSSGGLMVIGDGSISTLGGNNTGGIIQNNTSNGVSLIMTTNTTLQNMTIGDPAATAANSPDATANIGLNGVSAANSSNITLKNVKIARTGDHGFSGNSVSNFSMSNSLVLNAGNAQEENGLDFTQLSGDNFVTNSLFDAFNETGIEITNTSGSVDFTVSGTTFQDNTATVDNAGEEAILLDAQGTAQMFVLVTNNSIFQNLARQAIQATPVGTSVVHLTVLNSSFFDTNAGDAVVLFNPDGGASGNITVKGNTFNDPNIGPYAVLLKNDASGRLDATIQSNTMNNVAGVALNHDDMGSGVANGTSYVLIGGSNMLDGNIITNPTGFGIDVIASESPATPPDPDVHITIRNNQIGQIVCPMGFCFTSGIRISAQNFTRINLDINSNTATGSDDFGGGVSNAGIDLQQLDNSIFKIEGLTGGAAAYVNANNTSNTAATASGTYSSGNADLPTATTLPNP